MGILILAASITAVFLKVETWGARLIWIGLMAAGFFLIPGQAAIVAPVVVFIALFFKGKLDDMRGS